MSKIVDRRPTRVEDELRPILNRIAGLASRPHGVKVAEPGEGVLFETLEDEPRWLDGAWVADTEDRITDAAAEVETATEVLDLAQDELLLSDERLADAQERLDDADLDAEESAVELAEMVEMLGEHAVIVDEAQEELGVVLQDGLSTMAQRHDEIAASLSAVDSVLDETRTRLGGAEGEIRDAVQRAGHALEVAEGPVSGDRLVEGTVAGRHLMAEDVAATIGRFVKVQASNVEVTGELAASMVRSMTTETKQLVVTESAVMQHVTALSAEVLGVFKANRVEANEILVPGSVTAETIQVTDTLAANVLSAATAAATKAFVEQKLTVGESFEVLGAAVVNDLNLRGKLRGRDAIFAGTVDVAQLNITGEMAARVVSAMDVATRRLVVTDDAILNRATIVKSITTPLVDALETRTKSLLAQKASIADLEAGDLTLAGHFRSGAEGKPSVIIPQNYTTKAGMEQLGVWLSPAGVAPSLGAEWGESAGIWLDNASNVSGSTNRSPLNIRGQSGEGIRVYGGMKVTAAAGADAARIISDGTPLQLVGANGKNADLVAQAGGLAKMTTFGGGNIELRAGGTSADVKLVSGRASTIDANGDIELTSWSTTTIKGNDGLLLATKGNVALRTMTGAPYNTTTPSSGSWVSLYMDVNNGRVYRSTSARRYKAHIEPFVPDPSWLDMPVVTYIDAKDPEGGRPQIGTIAEDALDHGAEPLVMWSAKGAEDFRYERETPVLRYFLREQRDQITALTERIEALEGAA